MRRNKGVFSLGELFSNLCFRSSIVSDKVCNWSSYHQKVEALEIAEMKSHSRMKSFYVMGLKVWNWSNPMSWVVHCKGWQMCMLFIMLKMVDVWKLVEASEQFEAICSHL